MTPAVKAAERAGMAFELIEYEHDPRAPAYGGEAAQSIGQPPSSVRKTLVASING